LVAAEPGEAYCGAQFQSLASRSLAMVRSLRHSSSAAAECPCRCDPEDKGPNLSFQGRDRRLRSRSWLHLDLYTADQQAEVERLVALGARRYPWRYRAGDDFIVLEDPGGALFCVVQKADVPRN
jgi:hypothetical protein